MEEDKESRDTAKGGLRGGGIPHRRGIPSRIGLLTAMEAEFVLVSQIGLLTALGVEFMFVSRTGLLTPMGVEFMFVRVLAIR